MRICLSCEECLYDKQVHIASYLKDEKIKEEYLAEVKETLKNRGEEDSAPYMVYLFSKLQNKYGIPANVFPKNQYNDMMLSIEKKIEEKILASQDPLMTAIKFARIGNYIDFGAMNEVKPEVLMKMLEEEDGNGLEKEVYESFCEECSRAKTFLLLCDNCGEIVMDKLFLRQLKKRFPQLKIYAMVRGEVVLNDATVEDAHYCGLDQEAIIISNGNAVAGTEMKLLSDEARAIIDNADVILAKGQGNYESMSEYKGMIFFSFLCKCDLFMNRFNVPKLTGMFVKGAR